MNKKSRSDSREGKSLESFFFGNDPTLKETGIDGGERYADML